MKIEEEVAQLQKDVDAIKARNRRVEADKAWELSKTRTGFIAISTYILIVVFMMLLQDAHPFLNAFVATAAYLLSTSSYSVLKKWWLKRRVS